MLNVHGPTTPERNCHAIFTSKGALADSLETGHLVLEAEVLRVVRVEGVGTGLGGRLGVGTGLVLVREEGIVGAVELELQELGKGEEK